MPKNEQINNKGLHTDFSPNSQPQGTLRFALNTIDESDDGDINFLSNENSNVQNFSLPTGYIPIEKVYLENNQTAIFSVKEDETASEIGMKVDDNYVTVVNADLGFKLTNQIQAIYRLRRGCERIVYWVDGYNNPRIFNFDQQDEFKTGVNWDIDKFNLFKTYSLIPIFEEIEITEDGSLNAGSYNAAIQYLDEDFNPTEWIVTSDIINIFHSSYQSNFSEIRGSTNKETTYQAFGKTDKALRFEFSNLDTNFPYYRVAIIEATAGVGTITKVVGSLPIGTETTVYKYTGTNSVVNLTEEEILTFKILIDKVNHIEQVENRLILADTKGIQVNLCKLQKYASSIKADAVTKSIVLNNINNETCPKRGTIYFDNSVGYQPNEIYSLGIVYTGKNGWTSPTFHIPGRAVGASVDVGDFGMQNGVHPVNPAFRANELLTTTYENPGNCSDDYWGKDSEGNTLDGEPVRHHRFPSRATAGINFIDKTVSSTSVTTTSLNVGMVNTAGTPVTLKYKVEYAIDGGPSQFFEETITIPATFGTYGRKLIITTGTFTTVKLHEWDDVSAYVQILATVGTTAGTTHTSVNYTLSTPSETKNLLERDIRSDIMGIQLYDIHRPQELDGTDQEIVGYYIVRNERTDDNKTILDTVALHSIVDETSYLGFGSLMSASLPQSDRVFAFTGGEHLFHKKEYTNIDEIEILTERLIKSASATDEGLSTFEITEDVMAGTSYDPEVAKKGATDYDGFDLHTFSFVAGLDKNVVGSQIWSDIEEIFYLDALSVKSKNIYNGATYDLREIYNASSDNKVGIILVTGVKSINTAGAVYYGVLKRHLSDPYANFKDLPYYKDNRNIQYFDNPGPNVDECYEMYHGDSFVSCINFTNTCYYNTQLATREVKRGVWKTILGVVLTIVGTVVSVFGNIFLPAGAIVIGGTLIKFGVAMISSGITQEKLTKAYLEAYDAGLRDNISDSYVLSALGGATVDDELQFFDYTLKDLYLESTVNANLRVGSSGAIPDFLNAYQDVISISTANQYILEKLTSLDEDQHDGRLFQGFTAAEFYEVNFDYERGNKQKIFFHLPLIYDCCSPCLECYPHRVHYSEQAFQEELTDNYRVFLVNNYRDIEGETGRITNLFRIQDQLFIHTEEALWLLLQNYQEKIIGEIVSYLGTGEFFSIPPKRILDAEGNSGGSTHKWATIKTEFGVFFVSEKERKIYQFTGTKLTPISDNGRHVWFDKHISFNDYTEAVIIGTTIYDNPNKKLLNNPSNPIGKGYIAVYDQKLQRIIFTKRDYARVINQLDPDVKYYYYNSKVYEFENYWNEIDTHKSSGWSFLGISINVTPYMKFERIVNNILETDYIYGIVVDDFIENNKSWTTSYSLKQQRNAWISMHSYMPNFYLSDGKYFNSWFNEATGNYFWKHYDQNSFQVFYNLRKPYIVEVVALAESFMPEIWEFFQFYTEARKYDATRKEWREERFTTFNKAILYNTRQCTGEITLDPKIAGAVDYMRQQILNSDLSVVKIDKNEKIWSMNQIRDMRTNFDQSIFNTEISALQSDYYIDKIVNTSAISFIKDWNELESFRDKYLIIRLKFDNFEDVKLIFNSLKDNSKISYR